MTNRAKASPADTMIKPASLDIKALPTAAGGLSNATTISMADTISASQARIRFHSHQPLRSRTPRISMR
jgi:hypothetical protein